MRFALQQQVTRVEARWEELVNRGVRNANKHVWRRGQGLKGITSATMFVVPSLDRSFVTTVLGGMTKHVCVFVGPQCSLASQSILTFWTGGWGKKLSDGEFQRLPEASDPCWCLTIEHTRWRRTSALE